MPEKKITDFTSKYFDRYYLLPQFSEKELINLVEPIISKAISALKLNDKSTQELLKEIEEKNTIIVDNIKQQLTTIRKVKSFQKILQRNISKVHNDIYLPDLILISLVEVSRFELFESIVKNRSELSISPSDLESEFSFIVFPQFENLKKKYNNIISESNFDDIEKDILFELFPQIKITLEFEPDLKSDNIRFFRTEYGKIYEEIGNKNRLAHFLLIEKFFALENIETSIEKIISKEYKNNILSFHSEENPDFQKGMSYLEQLFPAGPSNSILRKLSLNWIKDTIRDYHDEVVSRNILLSLSFAAKALSDQFIGIFGSSEKKAASFFIWDYLRRRDSKKNILLTLLNYDTNSDTFTDNVLFYSIHEDRRDVILDKYLIDNIVVEYLKRIERKLKKADSIFDSSVFDDINSSIWRWKQALEYCAQYKLKYKPQYDIRKHIYDNANTNPINFEILFKNSFEDYGEEHISFLPQNMESVLTKDMIQTLIQNYIKEGKSINFDDRKLGALNKWLNG